jgi:hypothetical protein
MSITWRFTKEMCYQPRCSQYCSTQRRCFVGHTLDQTAIRWSPCAGTFGTRCRFGMWKSFLRSAAWRQSEAKAGHAYSWRRLFADFTREAVFLCELPLPFAPDLIVRDRGLELFVVLERGSLVRWRLNNMPRAAVNAL